VHIAQRNQKRGIKENKCKPGEARERQNDGREQYAWKRGELRIEEGRI
jgi:hypothetical protein